MSSRNPTTGRAALGAAADRAAGLVAMVPAVIDQATTDTSAAAWAALAGYGVVAAAGLAVRRHRPLAVFGVILAVLAVVEVAGAAAEVKLSGLAVLPVGFALYAVGAYSPRRRSIAAGVLGGVLIAGGLLVNHLTAAEEWRGGSDVLAYVAVLPVAWSLGVAAHSRRALLAAAEGRAADARAHQHLLAEQAAAAERVRIARDMHDVVAHSLTLLVVHAETLRARSDRLPPWARTGVDDLAAAGRQATAEMRDLLGVLRDDTGGIAPRSPAPTLAGLDELADTARRSGNPVTLAVTGPAGRLPRPVQLAGYRVVQECLSNARRHAPGADVDIRLDTGAPGIDLEITSGPPRGPVPGPDSAAGSGLGLAGLAERVIALGGHLSAGPTAGGGFRVAATIPATEGSHGALW
ncbi:sensor histidine kinase [Actinomadura viridis]|uniref:sensor histidine kinase n=1 Tax=Actinomadura viridis TaxID=58110 RepID=UPI0031EFF66A